VLNTVKAPAVIAACSGQTLVAPDIVHVEAISALRQLGRRGIISSVEADNAIRQLRAAPLRIQTTAPLVDHVWSLRANLTPYDATYVVLGRLLNCPLVTADARLARAPNLLVMVILV
jgi:predicted nucleic acid-binding protein